MLALLLVVPVELVVDVLDRDDELEEVLVLGAIVLVVELVLVGNIVDVVLVVVLVRLDVVLVDEDVRVDEVLVEEVLELATVADKHTEALSERKESAATAM